MEATAPNGIITVGFILVAILMWELGGYFVKLQKNQRNPDGMSILGTRILQAFFAALPLIGAGWFIFKYAVT